jgi:hypothetical protein
MNRMQRTFGPKIGHVRVCGGNSPVLPSLLNYLEHEELTSDNNAAERGIRTFVMGRKKWILCGSPEGAESSCALYSLIETAKENGHNPYTYLNSVFT